MSKALFSAITELATAFPRQSVPADTIKTYITHLSDYPEPAVIAACRLAVRSCTFFPSVREIIDLMDQEAAGDDSVAEIAWSEVLREVRRVGYQPQRVFRNGEFIDPPQPVFSSPLVRDTVESVGWRLICASDKPEDVRKQFIFTHRAMRKRVTNRIRRGDIATDAALDTGTDRALEGGAS